MMDHRPGLREETSLGTGVGPGIRYFFAWFVLSSFVVLPAYTCYKAGELL
jgi:hypothetical protein